MNNTRVLLTHFDLDGVSCDILLSKIFTFTKKHMSGYPKVKSKIDNGDISGYGSCIISDVSLTADQYKKMTNEYGSKLLYIDHHLPTKKIIESYNNGSGVVFDDTFCATTLILRTFFNKLKQYGEIIRFVSAVDAYDCWRHETHPEIFKIGYDLNILFWQYGYWKFFDRFSGSFSLDFVAKEREWIDEHNQERDKALDISDMNNFGKNSVFIMNVNSKYINEYNLQFPEYDLYYILYTIDNRLSLSCRSTLDDADLGKIVREVKYDHTDIVTAGGHPQAAGVDFVMDTPLDVIIDIVEDINDRIERRNEPIEELPF